MPVAVPELRSPPVCPLPALCVLQIHFDHPIKTIYIKSNPGTQGSAVIDGVTYRNITAHNSLWYPIWIGPQVRWCV